MSFTSEKLKQSRNEQEDEDLEFSFVCREPCTSPVPADKIFYKGKIKPFYQVLHKEFQLEDAHKDEYHDKDSINSMIYQNFPRLLPKKFLGQTSCASSEADELDGVQPGSYCVWTPKACKKNALASSSKKWRFKEILTRSKSESRRTAYSSPDARKEEKPR